MNPQDVELAPVPEWLSAFCMARDLPFIPGIFETWLDMRTVAALTGLETETVRKKSVGLPRHPRFFTFVRLGDFERMGARDEQ